MESDRFDALVRSTFANASRRGIVRAGMGTLTAAVLAGRGLLSEEADAKKKKKKKKKKKGSPPVTCPANLPVTCGTGCCPNEYSLCCVGNFGASGGLILDSVPGEATCNPPSFTCCPVEQGGGSCGSQFPKCCPATTQAPFGLCAESDATCCPSTAGGFTCPVERPKCCPSGSQGQNINQFSRCCLASQTCCQTTADCTGGQVCVNNCCGSNMMREPGARSASVPRSGIAAR